MEPKAQVEPGEGAVAALVRPSAALERLCERGSLKARLGEGAPLSTLKRSVKGMAELRTTHITRHHKQSKRRGDVLLIPTHKVSAAELF